MKFVANKEVVAHFELWKWVMMKVNGVTIAEAPKPTFIPNSTTISYTFPRPIDPSHWSGQIVLSRVPNQIEVWPFENGFNRITVDFINSETSFTVSGSVDNVNQPFPLWSYNDLPYVLPIVAIAVVLIFLGFERRGQKSKARSSRPGS